MFCSNACQTKYNGENRRGIPRSLKTREKIRLRAMGRVATVATIEKLRASHLGKIPTNKWGKGHIPWNKGLKGYHAKENNSNWKGGISDINSQYRGSIEYKRWRLDIFKRDLYTCQMCGYNGRDIEAHHIKKFENYPELLLDISNGITLCNVCHLIIRDSEQEYENLFFKLITQKGDGIISTFRTP